MQNGDVLESWTALKLALTQMFDRRVSFTAAMQKIEARRWAPGKESFDQYSIDKLALIHRLNLSMPDAINLIINGIPQLSLRATALTLPTNSLDKFLEAMRRITAGMGDLEKKSPQYQNKGGRVKDTNHRTGDTKGQKDTSQGTCNYCKKKGHWKAECLLLKRKEKTAPTSSPTAAKAETSSSHPTAAAVAETVPRSEAVKFNLSSPLIVVTDFNDNPCHLSALMDTGSPVSFVSLKILNKFFDELPALEIVDCKFSALPKTPIDILDKIKARISLREMANRVFDIDLHVVNSDFNDIDVIIVTFSRIMISR